jgi:hypothetical protein
MPIFLEPDPSANQRTTGRMPDSQTFYGPAFQIKRRQTSTSFLKNEAKLFSLGSGLAGSAASLWIDIEL